MLSVFASSLLLLRLSYIVAILVFLVPAVGVYNYGLAFYALTPDLYYCDICTLFSLYL